MRVTRAKAVRMAADVGLVQAALISAFVTRYLMVALDPGAVFRPAMASAYVVKYLRSSWIVAAIAVAAFLAMGFYSHGKVYRSRYKSAVVLYAVTFIYAAFAGMVFLLNNWFGIPRGLIPLGWAFTMLLVGGARVFSSIWRDIVQREERLFQTPLEQMTVRDVLVIGGAGYIGSALLPRLLDCGFRVRLLDLFLFGTNPISEWISHPNLQIVEGDFRLVDKIVESMRGMDAVIHLGGIVGDPACSLDEELTIDVNLAATRLVAQVARGEGVQRCIFASSCSVYGGSDELLDEESMVSPVSLYAHTKLASERVLLEMADQQFAPVILRFGTVYGLSGRTRFDLVINLLTAKAVKEGKITVFGGEQWRPFVHVEDVAEAVLLTLQAPLKDVRNEVFNVGSNEQNLTITGIAEMIAGIVPGSEVIHMGKETDKRNYRVDFTRIRERLGFKPAWGIERGIRQVAEAMRNGKVTDYTEARYSNLKSLHEDHTSKFFKPERDWPLTLLSDEQGANPTPDKGSRSKSVKERGSG